MERCLKVHNLIFNKDSNVPNRIWNLCLKKYSKKYLLVKDELGIWGIRSKYGTIQPYSLINNKLSFVADYPTARKKTYAMRKLPSFCTITQEGETDFVCSFDEDKLELLVDIFVIRKKRKLTKKTREHLAKHMKNIRLSKITV